MASHFASATRDETWKIEAGRARLTSSRSSCGEAELEGWTIVAQDVATPAVIDTAAREAELARAMLTSAMARVGDADVRFVVTAKATPLRAHVDTLFEVSIDGLSLIASPSTLQHDVEFLISRSPGHLSAPVDAPALPIVWRNGSAAVLMHEAAGHAAEAVAAPVKWPEWLLVRDVPDRDSDDAGAATRIANLLAGEAPSAFRRESFRDVPLPRMSSVVVTHRANEMAMPAARIEVHLTSGGSYDPLTDVVSVRVSSADLVEDGRVIHLRPFYVTQERTRLAELLVGACGGVTRYPGVICSREGQDLFVGSFAPDVLQEHP